MQEWLSIQRVFVNMLYFLGPCWICCHWYNWKNRIWPCHFSSDFSNFSFSTWSTVTKLCNGVFFAAWLRWKSFDQSENQWNQDSTCATRHLVERTFAQTSSDDHVTVSLLCPASQSRNEVDLQWTSRITTIGENDNSRQIRNVRTMVCDATQNWRGENRVLHVTRLATIKGV